MNREIKFRAWNKQQNKMLENFYGVCFPLMYDKEATVLVKDPTSVCTDPTHYPPDENILMQYTGLKDKNGKEIYEGDILKLTYSEASYKKEVIYNHTCFMLKGETIDSHERFPLKSQMEIIGNIYEHPEKLQNL